MCCKGILLDAHSLAGRRSTETRTDMLQGNPTKWTCSHRAEIMHTQGGSVVTNNCRGQSERGEPRGEKNHPCAQARLQQGLTALHTDSRASHRPSPHRQKCTPAHLNQPTSTRHHCTATQQPIHPSSGTGLHSNTTAHSPAGQGMVMDDGWVV
jgi:hypothetical protein